MSSELMNQILTDWTLASLQDQFPLWFGGESWCPMTDGGYKTVAPVGEVCYDCDEKIEEGDEGYIRPWVGPEEAKLMPIHKECDYRGVMGGINHQRGTCTCCGGSDPPDPPNLTKREAALAAWEYGHLQQGF